MRIEQTVEVDAPTKQVWEFVNDVPRVAPCMPGAKLTKVVDDRTYEGTVVVKLGPIRMTYKGTVVMDELDEANYTAKMSASGRDVKGAGTARAQVEARLEPVSDEVTKINVVSDVQLTGKVASFGRGAVQDVANKLFGQFAENLRQALNAEPGEGEETGGEQPGTGAASATTGATQPSAPAGPGASSEADTPPADTSAQPSATPQPAKSPGPASAGSKPEALEAGSLIGTVISGRAKSLVSTLGAFARGLRIRMRERR